MEPTNSYNLKNIESGMNVEGKQFYFQIKNSPYGNTRIFTLKSTEYPRLKAIQHAFLEILTNKTYIEGESFKKLGSSIANDQKVEGHETLAKSKKFTDFTRKLGLETAEHKKERVLDSWKLAIKQANIIGKGLLDKNDKTLHPEYWQEAIQPDHEPGFLLKDQVKRWQQDTDNKLNFTEWRVEKGLTGQGIVQVKYCDETERKDYLVNINNGQLTRNGQIFDTKNEETAFSGEGTAIFVISPDGKMYAGSHEEGEFHHSSFLAGGAIKAAGEMRTDSEGKIIFLSTKSGHYRPGNEEMVEALKSLDSQGVDLANIKVEVIAQSFAGITGKEFLERFGNSEPKK